jgi:Raf kinase inhibitor-like YbhB/YbcL family protein
MNIINNKGSRRFVSVVVAVAFVFTVFTVRASEAEAASKKMEVTSSGIQDGWINPDYCGWDSKGNINTRSIPLKIKNAPKKTKYYAVYMYDKSDDDFVQWLAANYTSKNFPANASKKKAKKMVQGVNGFGKIGYGAPLPAIASGTHIYVIKVYALKSKLRLEKGFADGNFQDAIRGKVLATATIKGKAARAGV